MTVVGHHGGSPIVKDIESARGRRRIVDERSQPGLDRGPVQLQRPRCGDRGHRVFNLKDDGSVAGQWNGGQRKATLKSSLGAHDVGTITEYNAFALRAMGAHDRVGAVDREERDCARAVFGHSHHKRIDSIEHRHATGGNVPHHHAFDFGQAFDRTDVVQAQVIADANVGDDRHIALVEGQSFAQDAAARCFKHCGIHIGMQQHIACAARAAAVSGVDAPMFDVDTVGIRHADALAGDFQQVRGQAHGGGLAVGARDSDDRNAGVFALREHGRDNGFTDRAGLAEGWAQMHAQTWRGVDLDDSGALFLHGFVHCFRHQIDPGNIQPDHVGRSDHARGQFRMDLVGHIGGAATGAEIGVVAQEHAPALVRNRIR